MENDNYTLIEKYLLGELSEEDRLSFQQRLKEDKAFKEEYDLQKSMNIFLEKDRNKAALQSQFEKLGEAFFNEAEETKVIPLKNNRNRFVIGIITAAAIGLLFFFWNPFQSGSIYDQYASHSPLALIEKSSGNESAINAEKYFNDKNYELAYTNLTTYLTTNPEDQRAKLALGISALETGKNAEAIDIFSQIKNGGSALKHYGTWYLALSYLKEKDFDKAASFLKEIPNSEKKLFDDAQEILGTIEKR